MLGKILVMQEKQMARQGKAEQKNGRIMCVGCEMMLCAREKRRTDNVIAARLLALAYRGNCLLPYGVRIIQC